MYPPSVRVGEECRERDEWPSPPLDRSRLCLLGQISVSAFELGAGAKESFNYTQVFEHAGL